MSATKQHYCPSIALIYTHAVKLLVAFISFSSIEQASVYNPKYCNMESDVDFFNYHGSIIVDHVETMC